VVAFRGRYVRSAPFVRSETVCAQVHWVYPYEKLRAINVEATVACLRLASVGPALVPLTFVSSTSVFDCEHYIMRSDRVREDDDLAGGTGLNVGYGPCRTLAVLVIGGRDVLLPRADGWVSARAIQVGGGEAADGGTRPRPAGQRGAPGLHCRQLGNRRYGVHACIGHCTVAGLIGVCGGGRVWPVTNSDDFLWRLAKGCVELSWCGDARPGE
jgi:hypothetical protein